MKTNMLQAVSIKKAYWFLLVCVLGIIAGARSDSIWIGKLVLFDQGILIMLAVVLLIPLFSEFEGFGFKLRTELGNLKGDIQRDFSELRTTLSATIANTQNISIRTDPVSEEVLERILSQLGREVPRANLPSADQVAAEGRSEIPEEVARMFEIRWALEHEVIRIARERGLPDPVGGAVFSLVTGLAREKFILDSADHAFREIYKIASRAIHGNLLTPDQRDFVEEAAPRVISALRAVQTSTT